MRRFVSTGSIVFDVEANIGYYTLLFAKLAGPTGTVHAFEPTSYAFRRLSRNVALNPGLVSTLALNNVGLLARPIERDEAIESQFSQRRPAYSRRESIRFTTIAEYCETRGIGSIDFLKVDVDGYDEEVVVGGREILERTQPVVLGEFCDRVLRDHGTSLEGYVHLYESLGSGRYVKTPDASPTPLAMLLQEPDIEDRTVNAVLLPARYAGRITDRR